MNFWKFKDIPQPPHPPIHTFSLDLNYGAILTDMIDFVSILLMDFETLYCSFVNLHKKRIFSLILLSFYIKTV